MKWETASGMVRLVHIVALAAVLFGFGAAPVSASAGMGIDKKAPHAIAVSAFGSPLLPRKVNLLSMDSRRVLLSISSVKILPVLVEGKPVPVNWFDFEDTTLFEEVAPYLWFVAALLVLTLVAQREVRNAAIPAPRPKPPAGPWNRLPPRA